MCGRFTLSTPPAQLVDLFDLDGVPDWSARYNVAPSQRVLCVRVDEREKRRGALLHWGLIPSWAKDRKIAYRMINARCETLSEKPAFRSAFKKRRCLVLADGFYEWEKIGKTKQPYAIRMSNDLPFALAGLWERWKSKENEEIESVTIVTTRANELLRPIHDRMPVILRARDFVEWLDPKTEKLSDADATFEPYSVEEMKSYRVSPHVSNVRNDDPSCLTPDNVLF